MSERRHRILLEIDAVILDDTERPGDYGFDSTPQT